MCRISGFWDFTSKNYDPNQLIEKMNDSLAHGGPDGQGVFVDQAIGLALGHRRLAIIEPSDLGRQPMLTTDSRFIITFNGEIYNFQSIKKELVTLGRVFKSNSDTEVILQAYNHWGIKCLEKFRGMFALAIFDQRDKALTLIHDRVGVKPLYYYWHDDLFMFASETRAFLQHPKFKRVVNPTGLASYFKFGYLPHPHSIWQHVHKLPPGSILRINNKKEIKIDRYWRLEDIYAKQLDSRRTVDGEGELICQLEDILKSSFKLRMVADVPVGVFLSGGIDSSIVTAMLQKESSQPLRTFSIGFGETEFNEAGHARRIAQYLGTDHQEILCQEKDGLEIVPRLPEIYDEPFGDSSSVPTYLVSKFASQSVKVVLSGDGGDEFFGGYDKYWRLIHLPIYRHSWPWFSCLSGWFGRLVPQQRFYKFNKALQVLASGDIFNKFALTATGFLNSELQNLLRLTNGQILENLVSINFDRKKISQLDVVSKWMFLDAYQYLPEDILTKVDRASMHVALETREPLLDQEILEFIAGLPVNYKCNKDSGKLLLKRVLAKYLPKEYFDRPKQGFCIPMRKWLLNDLKILVDQYLSADNLKRVGILDVNYVNKFVGNFYKNKHNNFYKVWYLLIFQMWANRWL